ncbi:MAG: STAS/SEC14 domain-containing protein [Polyangiaceae bacterium]
MLKRMEDLPAGVDGVQATGTVTTDDYEQVMRPLLEAARREGRRVRFLYQVGPGFEGFTAGAAWDDARIGMRYLRRFEACAIVTDVGWIRDATRFMAPFMPCPARVFTSAERTKATTWLASLSDRGASHRLMPEFGIVLVEVKSALRPEDFDSVAATVDAWLEAHGELQALVIHTPEFPGWENFAALLHQIRFVHDHHRKIHRVALVANGNVANLAPRVAEHFVKAEIKHFDYDALDQAIEWAKK